MSEKELQEYRQRQHELFLRRKREREATQGSSPLFKQTHCEPLASHHGASWTPQVKDEQHHGEEPSVADLDLPDTSNDALIAQCLAKELEEEDARRSRRQRGSEIDEASAAVISSLIASDVAATDAEGDSPVSETRPPDQQFCEQLITTAVSPEPQQRRRIATRSPAPAQQAAFRSFIPSPEAEQEEEDADVALARRLQEEEYFRDSTTRLAASVPSTRTTVSPPLPVVAKSPVSRVVVSSHTDSITTGPGDKVHHPPPLQHAASTKRKPLTTAERTSPTTSDAIRLDTKSPLKKYVRTTSTTTTTTTPITAARLPRRIPVPLSVLRPARRESGQSQSMITPFDSAHSITPIKNSAPAAALLLKHDARSPSLRVAPAIGTNNAFRSKTVDYNASLAAVTTAVSSPSGVTVAATSQSRLLEKNPPRDHKTTTASTNLPPLSVAPVRTVTTATCFNNQRSSKHYVASPSTLKATTVPLPTSTVRYYNSEPYSPLLYAHPTTGNNGSENVVRSGAMLRCDKKEDGFYRDSAPSFHHVQAPAWTQTGLRVPPLRAQRASISAVHGKPNGEKLTVGLRSLDDGERLPNCGPAAPSIGSPLTASVTLHRPTQRYAGYSAVTRTYNSPALPPAFQYELPR